MSGLIFSLIFIQVSIFVAALCLVISSIFLGLRMRATETVRPLSFRQYKTRRLNVSHNSI